MPVNNAYKLCLAILAQNAATGSQVFPGLSSDAEYNEYKWGLQSVIPSDYDFTNFQAGDATVETVEKNTITVLSKAKKYESGSLTPPTYTFASMTPADCASIVGTLDALLNIDDPFKVLLLAAFIRASLET